MNQHAFIFASGRWFGEGQIQLNMVDEELGFITRWNVSHRDPLGKIECLQEIQVKGISDVMTNQFSFFDFIAGNFTLELENHALGKVQGKGILSDTVIAWEFRIPELGFEGFEFYEKEAEDVYLMRAEYATAEQFRTLIQGKVWKQIGKEDPS
jgi:hypothetical protein